MKRALFLCVLMASFCGPTDLGAAGIALSLFNGSFEIAGTSESDIPGWTTHPSYGSATATISTEMSRSGNASMKLVDASSSGSLARITQPIPIKNIGTYSATAYAYIKQGGIQLHLVYYSGTTEIKRYSSPVVDTPTLQWTKLSISGVAPSGADSLAVMLYSPLTLISTVYIDDVSVGQTIQNGGFEEALAGTWKTSTSGASVSVDQKFSGTQSLKLSDTSTIASATAESLPVPISPGTRVGASAQAYMDSGSGLSIQLVFRDSAGVLLPNSANLYKNTFSGSLKQWRPLLVSATAPTGAASVSVAFATVAAQTSVSYIDEVNLSTPIAYDLGVQIKNNPISVAAFGKDRSGFDNLMYVGSSGYPSRLAVYNARNGALVDDVELKSTEAVWGLTVASDGPVYIGTAKSRQFFRYIPGSDLGGAVGPGTLSSLTLPKGMEITWDVSAASHDGIVYGGTSDSGTFFKYDPRDKDNSVTHGLTVYPGPIVTDLQYVRSLAYASDTEVYLGVASPARLIRYNPTTQLAVDVTPGGLGTKYIIDLNYVPNGAAPRLFAQIPDGPIAVIDLSTNKIIKALSGATSKGVSPKSGDYVYYTKSNVLYRYSLSQNAEFSIGNVGGDAVGYSILPYGSSVYLYATLSSGNILKYNLSTGAIDLSTKFTVPLSPTKIRSLVQGPFGNIYSSGFLLAGMGIYNPYKGNIIRLQGGGQAENMTSIGSSLYMGVYPGAIVKKYDTTLQWNDSGSSPNPSTLFSDMTVSPYFQDRPFGMLAVPVLNKLYVGTVASSGHLDGALSVYDIGSTGPKNIKTELNVVDQQGVVSLAYANGKVFGGTTVYGGSSTTPTKSDAEIFVWDTATDTKITEFIPSSERKIVSDLVVGPDGKLWGLAEGDTSADLIIVDPNTPDVAHTQVYANKFSLPAPTKWQGGKIAVRADGNIYVAIGDALYAVDAATKAATKLIPSGVSLLATDFNGDLYYVNYLLELVKYEMQ